MRRASDCSRWASVLWNYDGNKYVKAIDTQRRIQQYHEDCDQVLGTADFSLRDLKTHTSLLLPKEVAIPLIRPELYQEQSSGSPRIEEQKRMRKEGDQE